MKKLLLVVISIVLLGVTSVYAAPNPESSELVIDGKVLYQKGAKTSETVPGVTFDEQSMTVVLSDGFAVANGEGLKIMNMDSLTVKINSNITMNLLERADGLFIVNTKVTLDSDNNSKLVVVPEEGSGIIVDGDSELYIKSIGLDVVSIRFKDQKIEISDNAVLNSTKFYKDGNEVDASSIVQSQEETQEVIDEPIEEPTTGETPQFKRRDSFGDIAVYAVVAGLIIVGGIAVLLIAVKNQDNGAAPQEPKQPENENKQ